MLVDETPLPSLQDEDDNNHGEDKYASDRYAGDESAHFSIWPAKKLAERPLVIEEKASKRRQLGPPFYALIFEEPYCKAPDRLRSFWLGPGEGLMLARTFIGEVAEQFSSGKRAMSQKLTCGVFEAATGVNHVEVAAKAALRVQHLAPSNYRQLTEPMLHQVLQSGDTGISPETPGAEAGLQRLVMSAGSDRTLSPTQRMALSAAERAISAAGRFSISSIMRGGKPRIPLECWQAIEAALQADPTTEEYVIGLIA